MGRFIKKIRRRMKLNKPNWDKKHIRYERDRRENQSKEAKKQNQEKKNENSNK